MAGVPQGQPEATGEVIGQDPTPGLDRSSRPRSTRNLLFVGIAVIIATMVVVFGVALATGHHHAASAGPATQTLLPQDFLISIPNGNYYGVSFVANSSSILNATYTTIYPVHFYLMTPAEFQYMVTKDSVSSYVWTSLSGQYGTFHYLNLAIQPGVWVFAMANTDPVNTTAVGFNTPLTLTPS
jgi:hypothetical protein